MTLQALTPYRMLFFGTLVIVICMAAASHAGDSEEPLVVQLMYGQMTVSVDDYQGDTDDYVINLFGVAGQKPYGGSLLKYGLETGALFNWQSDVRAYSVTGGGGGGSATVALDITSFLLDYFFGGYVSIEPLAWLRFYLGAGPLLIGGMREIEQDDPATQEVESKSDSGLGFGLYGRTGVDVVIAKKYLFGVGMRGTQTTLSFKDETGEFDVQGLQYFVGFSFKM